ncbi:S41 family peptidase [Algoriphagus hitonicola]|uniref:C-terminal processing protease CtpA/Prc, contains a PDZ domain n=1 Tax=Algoriphagus hitonicola TaxID=435880 RepID=A0A1I2NKX9_9BACT|nr:S41 family peptidase [Algoriphagus hitonicola]SFG02116.1 C-terminal processing protease CtpA/Prc, contains a PDZ domain [Algoriphagus hitonicola]
MKLLKYSTLLLILGLSISCKDREEPTPQVDPGSNAAVNQWIQDVMDEVYYWLDDIGTPIAEESDPEDYFESLLFRPTDRFSVIYPDFQELINSLNGIELEAGYEFILYRESAESDNVIAQISYVKRNSPAKDSGLRRGDIIQTINGQQMNVDNFQTILSEISSTHTINFLRFNEESDQYESQGDLELTPVQLAENPNFLDSIYTIENQKIGYVVYHFFAPGSGNNSTSYDQEMDAIFAEFKAEGIDHLIVDFRYNGGGFVSSAVNLASLIAPGVGEGSVFSKTKYNSFLSQFDDFQDVQTEFRTKEQNLGNTLSGNRVYFLTSGRTASASELIINGLRPYMDVFLIGDVTTGKNVGSIPFEDDENPENSYGILPIVTQSFNSDDESDYTEGFTPNITVTENQERARQFGDVNELLLRTAIEQITGTPSSGRIEKLDRIDLGSTLDHKTRAGTMIESKSLHKN